MDSTFYIPKMLILNTEPSGLILLWNEADAVCGMEAETILFECSQLFEHSTIILKSNRNPLHNKSSPVNQDWQPIYYKQKSHLAII